MTDPAEQARERYVAEYESFRLAGDSIESHLVELLKSLGIRAHIEVRAKTVGSFVKKMHIKRYSDPWSEITDKLGGRIVVKTLDDLQRVKTAFESGDTALPVRGQVEDKSEQADVGALFYPGVHVQVAVPGFTTSTGEEIECELQVRTKAQDLWSVPSHELVYKGVVEPSRQTKRRILRLSVLTEMFDEEVRLAMQEVAADPRYKHALLLRASEALYLAFVAEPGEDELSLEVLDLIAPSLPDDPTYAESLKQFVDDNREKVADVLETYGVRSEFGSLFAYWLFSQPEALVIMERMSNAPQALAEAVRGTEIEDPVRRLFGAWGTAMPAVV